MGLGTPPAPSIRPRPFSGCRSSGFESYWLWPIGHSQTRDWGSAFDAASAALLRLALTGAKPG
jgi:hypothetical protein